MQRNGYEEETRVDASGKWELMKFSADLFREVFLGMILSFDFHPLFTAFQNYLGLLI
jgi:hypothetical protein